MLNQLVIKNFAIVDALELDFNPGMTAISGETGAGKSIMLDALGLTLGDRADSDSVRQGAERAEIIASFDIRQLPAAQGWLADNDLDSEDECIIRRVITREGRSRGYINGQASPLAALKALGENLIAIHGQHEHQQLLKKEHHRFLLDQFAGCSALLADAQQAHSQWHKTRQRLESLTSSNAEQEARAQLLRYQVEELEQLSLQPGELAELEREHKELNQAEDILHKGHQALQITADAEQDTAASLIGQALQLVAALPVHITTSQISDMLNSAYIQLEEASQELRHYLERIEINPTRLQEVEERLSSLYEMARKHRVSPEELPALQEKLQEELTQLDSSDEAIAELEQQVTRLFERYQQVASELSRQRQSASTVLNQQIDSQLHSLGMAAATFNVQLTPVDTPQPYGLEQVEFLITTNAGQPLKPLAKIASGGELSRISLAIQVVTAQVSTTPTLIFDEVDVGIGGGIAEVVGRMLRQLGNKAQVMCVTHQPQVASQGHQHLFVSKAAKGDKTHTKIATLESNDRVREIARMLGGIDITQRTLDHAREMLGLTAPD